MTIDSAFAAQLHASAERLFHLLECFEQVRVMAVGDLALDEFVTGQVERISGKRLS